MAGSSSRFLKEGYNLPKYMLPLGNSYVFDFALSSFANLFNNDLFIFVSRDIHNTPDFIHQRAKALGIKHFKIKVLSEETRGQAETVFLGLEDSKNEDEHLCIFNIDSQRRDFKYRKDLLEIDGYLEVFKDAGSQWSFVQPLENTDKVLKTTEKIRISELCSNGLYVFRSVELFKNVFLEESNSNDKELYIAPMYNRLIEQGCDVRFSLISRSLVEFCGVPAEYEYLLSTLPKLS